MIRQADVIVVGGGLMGTATAFFLRRRGLSVILLERDRIGSHASGTNFGNVRRQGRFPAQLPLANRSRRIWGQLPELLGADVEFLQTGHIRAAICEDGEHSMETFAHAALPYDLKIELLSQSEMRKRFGFFGKHVKMGSFSPEDGHANPRLCAPAFARAAKRIGAQVIEGCEVITVEKGMPDFEVTTETHGAFRAPVVQVSSGAWGPRISASFGEPVPAQAMGPQMAVTDPMPYRLKPVIGIWSASKAQNIYCRQVARGNIVFGGGQGGPASLETKRATVLPSNTDAQITRLTQLIPAMKTAHVIRSWSGVEGYVDDGLPVMGSSATTPGLFYAFGFCGHGFQLGPGVGDVMAELIATGQTTTPIESFLIRRFNDG